MRERVEENLEQLSQRSEGSRRTARDQECVVCMNPVKKEVDPVTMDQTG